jgi:hypothetical protein
VWYCARPAPRRGNDSHPAPRPQGAWFFQVQPNH